MLGNRLGRPVLSIVNHAAHRFEPESGAATLGTNATKRSATSLIRQTELQLIIHFDFHAENPSTPHMQSGVIWGKKVKKLYGSTNCWGRVTYDILGCGPA